MYGNETMELWRLPNILVVHLKRFSSSTHRDGISLDTLATPAGRPRHECSLCSHLLSLSTKLYPLITTFAVTNHFVEWTAITQPARRWDESGYQITGDLSTTRQLALDGMGGNSQWECQRRTSHFIAAEYSIEYPVSLSFRKPLSLSFGKP
jgi:hypothetical protein